LRILAKGNINVNIDNGLEIKLFFREVAQRYSDSLNPLNFATLLKIPGVLGNLITSGCVKTNFEFLFSHYSTLFDYKLGLLNHFLSVFYLFLPLFATLNQIF